ncbi:hypothetical protein LOTGIDRAFT_228384 [Lottia gigantea]|uniref:GOLD domain-containing protein n=1 Tax=Lottia gigantea TaxID=225164 RepID=V4A201_LOTGI|nr:hypothetical protein LOTGIDRAFT_228384 [Lottia gigantea]ESO97838.1 hypothetical protein LOTGIDRAFT_228384 [Lottia gigantea]
MAVWWRIVTLSLTLLVKLVATAEVDLTLEVSAGQEECLFQFIKKPSNLEVEYQVIEGGDLDVDFSIISPNGQRLAHDLRKSENVHKVEVKVPGAYRFCMDNSFSRFTHKVVFFELLTEDDEDEDDKDWDLEKDEIAEYIDMTIEDLKTLIGTVKSNLEKTSQIQSILRVYESRDRSQMEHNYERVNFMSGVQVFIMLSVGITQVLMIRNLFTEKYSTGTKTHT